VRWSVRHWRGGRMSVMNRIVWALGHIASAVCYINVTGFVKRGHIVP
jgi:hypothetical protein